MEMAEQDWVCHMNVIKIGQVLQAVLLVHGQTWHN